MPVNFIQRVNLCVLYDSKRVEQLSPCTTWAGWHLWCRGSVFCGV